MAAAAGMQRAAKCETPRRPCGPRGAEPPAGQRSDPRPLRTSPIGVWINADDLHREVVRAALLQRGRDNGVRGRIEVIGIGGNQLRELAWIDVRVNAVSRQDEHIT